MGLGKTLTSIAAADTIGAKSILVLCLAVGKTHWMTEFQRWQAMSRSIGVIHGMTQADPGTDVVVANYDLVSRDSIALKTLLKRKFDLLILDECHSLKTRTSKRTRAVYGLRCDRAKGLAANGARIWALSGTPAPNHAGELYTHLRALYPAAILNSHGDVMTEQQFVEAFCTYRDTPFGRQITGSKNLDALRARMSQFLYRKRKVEVLADLPPLTFQTLAVNPNDTKVPPHVLRDLGRADMEVANDLQFTGNMMAGGAADTDLLTLLRGARTDQHLATQRRLAGQIKAEVAIDLVTQELRGNDRKIILFAHHQSVIDRLVAGLADAGLGVVKIDGRDSHAERDNAVRDFQGNPHVRVFVGQLQAAGTSITLTAASDVLFVEASWVPSENVQAACRAHRIGQKDGVLARFLTLDGSLDRQIMNVVARKSRDLAVLIDNEPVAPATSPFTEVPA